MKKAVSLYLTILILSILSASLLALISISISQIKVVFSISDSLNAFYGADTGVERALYRVRKQSDISDFSGSVSNVFYDVSVDFDPGLIIKSVGSFKNTKRAIEARY